MNRLLIVLGFVFLAFSCSTIEDNSPALQGLNDNVLFKAATSQAKLNPDGSIFIRGLNGAGESVDFRITSQASQVGLGGSVENENVAVYTNQAGNDYSTAFDDASGTLEYTINGTESITGNFKFIAFAPGKSDTVVFSRGVIYEVPFVTDIIIGNPNNESLNEFVALLNTTVFDAIIIADRVEAGILTVSGQTNQTGITIVVPVNTPAGAYDLLEGTPIYGAYNNLMGDFESISGTLTILSNDTSNNIMNAQFEFETEEGFSITEGMFTVYY